MTTYVIPDYFEDQDAAVEAAPQDLIFIPRSRKQWIPFLFPLVICGISWAGGGIPALTDIGFTMLTVLCCIYLVTELIAFPRRFGIGGLLLWGGILIWFCHDYYSNWFMRDFFGSPMPAWVIAKAAYYHVLFIMLMSISLNWQTGRWLEKIILSIPDPDDSRFYICIMLTMFAFGLIPYFLFNGEVWYMCIYHSLFAGWVGSASFTVYRSGNLNYNWGGYVAQIMQVGSVSGIVAIIYTILIAKSWGGRLLGLFIWWFYAMISFESGRRGEICFTILPPIALLFIKYQAQTAALFHRFSIKAYLLCGFLLLSTLFIVQFQATFRDVGYIHADLSQLDLTKNQGNTMFSEGLIAYASIGETMPFFYANDFPGEGFFRAIPQTAFDFFAGAVPRALWHDKPVDGLWKWYNEAFNGQKDGTVGGTVSHGLVGSWYFKYGLGGVIEGALLVGWLMGVSERALQHSEGKPIGMLMSLGVATWLFRCFRDFMFNDLYELLMGAAFLFIFIPLLRPILGGKRS